MSGNVEPGKRIVYACSGCADVGEIADRVARKLRQDGYATPKASCLAGIGAGLQTFIDAAKVAQEVVTIDGCPVFCSKKIIENAGITPVAIELGEMGCEKGNTPYTPELVQSLTEKIIARV
jgi:uncharacterized metal-binding protein